MKKIYTYALVAVLAINGAGCKKLSDFGGTNDNPDGTTVPVPSAILTNVQANFASYASTATEAISGAQYAQYFSETQYSSTSLYALSSAGFTGRYNGDLYDLQNIKNLNVSNNMSQVATIMQQYIFWVLTDTWGDVPYSEALQGPDKPNPKYDTQEAIYKGILSNLATAVGSMDNSAISGDVIYNGNAAAWKKAANSLRMLAAIQLSKKYPGASEYAATEFKAALADANGYIAVNSENLAITFPGLFKSTWFNLYDGRKDFAESKTLTDLTGSLSDARQNAFGGASEVPGSTQTSNVGVPYGVKRETAEAFTGANPTWAKVLRGDLRTDKGTVVVISAAEVALARAEAADRGWTTENLNAVYQNGIALSYAQWGVGAPSAGYYANGNVALTAAAGTNANIRNISVQRYLASYPDGHKAWNIWRKSGFPVLTPAPDAVNASKQIVQRFIYPSTEYSTNEVNVKEAEARLPGGNTMDAKVWWNQ